MGEKLSNNDYSALAQKLEGWVRASHEPPTAYRAAKAEYYQERYRAVAAGKPTWIVRSFDEEEVHHYDFYRDGDHVGSVEEDTRELTCRVETADEREYIINGPGWPIFEAVAILENKII